MGEGQGLGVGNEGCGGRFRGSRHLMMYGCLSFILAGFTRITLFKARGFTGKQRGYVYLAATVGPEHPSMYLEGYGASS